MKLAYERPMMHAEMYQTDAYCISSCDTNPDDGEESMVGMKGVNLKDGLWYHVPGALGRIDHDNPLDHNNAAFTSYGNLDGLTFGGVQNPMEGTGGADQYYWSTTTSNGDVYHLEFSDGWTNKWNQYSGNDYASAGKDDQVFVLYKEDGAYQDSYHGSTNAGALDADVNGTAGGGYPGSQDDNDGTYTVDIPFGGSVEFPYWSASGRFDDSILAVVFRAAQIFSYWS